MKATIVYLFLCGFFLSFSISPGDNKGNTIYPVQDGEIQNEITDDLY